MDEILIKHLGPIQEVRIKPSRLTLLVGEQACGKSLVAQVTYFFRAIRSLVARYYSPELVVEEKWQEKLVKKILDDLRGVPFGYFANGTAYLHYREEGSSWWSIHVYKSNRSVRLNKAFKDYLSNLVQEWISSGQKSDLSKEWIQRHIFIPTERSVFTRLSQKAPTVLYAEHQPLLLRLFAEYLDTAKDIYSKLYEKKDRQELADAFGRDWMRSVDYVLEQQRRTIRGEAYTPSRGPKLWKWMVGSTEGKSHVLPIEATASGQMEAWPFFVVAATFNSIFQKMSVYFEEPETHLHPAAQVELMRTIVYLVNREQSFFLTSHSPYVLYEINNMLQRFKVREKGPARENQLFLDPTLVSAYQIKSDGTALSLLDHEETGLVDASELERVAEELGSEFEDLLRLEEPEA